MTVWRRVLDALDRRHGAAMVTVGATRGSSPREPGARMIVNADGTFTGTIGGGTLEWQAIALAQAALTTGRRAERRQFNLGPELGQCCGGQVDLVVESFSADDRDAVAFLAECEAKGPFATRGRFGEGPNLDRTIVDEKIVPGCALLTEDALVEGFGEQLRTLLLFGAGHVGKALVLALAPLPFGVCWHDPRPEAFPALVPANVTTHRLDDPSAAFAPAPAESFVLVMSHSHQLDLALVHTALADRRFAYVGLIGSKTKRARFEKRLITAGVPDDRVEELVCPIGIGGVTSKHPAAIAAATVAQLLEHDEALYARAMSESAGSATASLQMGSRS
ncbi:MAG: xanthine dehydrogenase accessory protein XdhC [Hyphomicrobiales bacterium]|nr:xanthine dehydrogenase accessory protein XdhC [Hyphomicrobiales bacterium]